MARSVTVIPASIDALKKNPSKSIKKRRVAGYARVSTDSDEQFTSYQAQLDYYENFIKEHDNWKFLKVYADEGITGTNTRHRVGFNEMIKDALDGKIDLIVTKSISRFARNTVDTLSHVRMLKDKGVEVYFEKENIWTFDGNGEILITIMSSIAQEESRSISENVTWGQRKRFADGKVSLPYKRFLGYKKGANDLPEIVPEEAKIVQLIYQKFIDGETAFNIAKELTEMAIPTPSGKQKWQRSTIESILSNEKYRGDARLQKTFTVDFLTKKMKANEGEVPQYYVTNSHPAIIIPEEWDMVQRELERRKNLGKQYSGKTIFSSKIICGDCGAFYGSKTWHSTSKYKKTVMQCNKKFDNKCTTPNLDEQFIQDKFVEALNRVIANKENIIDDCRLIQTAITDCSDIDKQLDELMAEIEIITELTKRRISENATQAQNQTDYNSRYNQLVERYETTKAKIEQLQAVKKGRERKADAIGAFMFQLSELEPIAEFNRRLWITILESVTVFNDGSCRFKFIGGKEIQI